MSERTSSVCFAALAADQGQQSGRDLRLDLFRGLSLLFIFIDHIPNNVMSYVTLHSIAFSDAAEVFGDLDAIGIDLGDVFAMLESESLISLERAWLELLDCVRRQLAPEPR